jgi:hypothetical protein
MEIFQIGKKYSAVIDKEPGGIVIYDGPVDENGLMHYLIIDGDKFVGTVTGEQNERPVFRVNTNNTA